MHDPCNCHPQAKPHKPAPVATILLLVLLLAGLALAAIFDPEILVPVAWILGLWVLVALCIVAIGEMKESI